MTAAQCGCGQVEQNRCHIVLLLLQLKLFTMALQLECNACRNFISCCSTSLRVWMSNFSSFKSTRKAWSSRSGSTRRSVHSDASHGCLLHPTCRLGSLDKLLFPVCDKQSLPYYGSGRNSPCRGRFGIYHAANADMLYKIATSRMPTAN